MRTRCIFLTGLLFVLSSAFLQGQSSPRVLGRLIDARTEHPIEGAAVSLPDLGLRTVTDADGRFRFVAVPPGTHAVRVEHIAYGTHVDAMNVGAGTEHAFQMALTQRALQLEPIDVSVLRREGSASTRSNVITRDMIESVAGRSRHIGDLVRSYIPSASVSEARGGFLCLEFRGASSSRTTGCNYPLIVLDGLPVTGAPRFLRDLSVQDLERVEYVPASQGAVRYGFGATHGVLVIDTRRSGIVPAEVQETDGRFPNYAWSAEPSGHPTARAFLGATAGALAGSLAGLAAVGCLPGTTDAGVGCLEDAGAGAGLAALTLPLVASTVGARWMGRTDRSRGKWLPSLVMTALPAALGYSVYVDGERSGFRSERLLGVALVSIATPLVSTLADHLFRSRLP
ncbi:MAG: TonB-dependent receptor [Gemmatimonadota bacterium]|nr:TonB-dependent receptor [Gemmatimonadota bacterium]